ncbi:MAG TPA: AraC family transcriptional regulator [Luteibacter sp.]|jgi:AraC-like DNA-binding protein|nr:AraC family transcriptional regulator [Luteibacter sp.]
MQPLAAIRSLIARHAKPGDRSTVLPGVRLVTATAPTAPVNGVCEPAFALVAQGVKRTMLADKVFDYGAGRYLVVSVDLPIVGHIVEASPEAPYLAFVIRLDPAAIATLLLDVSTGAGMTAETCGMSVSEASNDLLDAVVRLLRLLDRPEDVAVLGPMLEREILWRLLAGEQGAAVRQVGLADSRLSQISRAIAWIRTHYAASLRIDALADVAGMSTSTFHRHFRAVTAMSPVQYQKRIRLLEARTRLIADAKDVAAVGFDVGYDSPSQFSREYSRFFGAPPGKDMKRWRGDVGLAQALA